MKTNVLSLEFVEAYFSNNSKTVAVPEALSSALLYILSPLSFLSCAAVAAPPS